MRPKNYGLMSQTKRYNRPTAKQSVQYLAEIFGIDDINNVVNIVRKIKGNTTTYHEDETIATFARNVFLEKQLEKHGRDRLCKDIDLSAWPTTLSGIIKQYIAGLDENGHESRETARQRVETRTKYNNKIKQQSKNQPSGHQQPPRLSTDTRIEKEIQGSIDNGYAGNVVKNSIEDTPAEDKIADWDSSVYNHIREASKSASEVKLSSTIQGEHVNKALSQKLTKILDTILGHADIRSQERGYSRPSRASHFIKNCFLPSYKSNKPRKRPAFFIDASSSMQYYACQAEAKGFSCKTSAISSFLRTQKRRISELRPRFYAFSGNDIAMQFDIDKTLPVGYGGTSLGFLGAVNDKDINVILTDAQFESADLGALRIWAGKHPQAEVHWIVDTEFQGDYLRKALQGYKNQHVHVTEF